MAGEEGRDDQFIAEPGESRPVVKVGDERRENIVVREYTEECEILQRMERGEVDSLGQIGRDLLRLNTKRKGERVKWLNIAIEELAVEMLEKPVRKGNDDAEAVRYRLREGLVKRQCELVDRLVENPEDRRVFEEAMERTRGGKAILKSQPYRLYLLWLDNRDNPIVEQAGGGTRNNGVDVCARLERLVDHRMSEGRKSPKLLDEFVRVALEKRKIKDELSLMSEREENLEDTQEQVVVEKLETKYVAELSEEDMVAAITRMRWGDLKLRVFEGYELRNVVGLVKAYLAREDVTDKGWPYRMAMLMTSEAAMEGVGEEMGGEDVQLGRVAANLASEFRREMAKVKREVMEGSQDWLLGETVESWLGEERGAKFSALKSVYLEAVEKNRDERMFITGFEVERTAGEVYDEVQGYVDDCRREDRPIPEELKPFRDCLDLYEKWRARVDEES